MYIIASYKLENVTLDPGLLLHFWFLILTGEWLRSFNWLFKEFGDVVLYNKFKVKMMKSLKKGKQQTKNCTQIPKFF